MHDHFLKLICANPADIGPRLVYADWLEERGDPRGEFIRVQCAIDRMTYGDPQYTTLIQRESELLGKHEKEWLRPLEQLLGPNEPRQPVAAVTGWLGSLLPQTFARMIQGMATSSFPAWRAGFNRGFVESIDIENSRLTNVNNLSQRIPLRRLNVSSSDSALINPLAWMTDELMRHIIVLRIHVTSIESPLWRQTWQRVQFPALERISLVAMPAHGLAALADAEVGSRLTSIFVSACPFDSSDIETFSRFPRLEDMALRDVSIDATSIGVLSSQSLCQHLRGLKIQNCMIGNAAVLHIGANRFRMMRYLGLESCEIGDSAAEYLAANRLLGQLSELSLVDNLVTEQGAMALADSTHWRGTTRIDLRENPISPDVRRALKIRFGDRILVDDP